MVCLHFVHSIPDVISSDMIVWIRFVAWNLNTGISLKTMHAHMRRDTHTRTFKHTHGKHIHTTPPPPTPPPPPPPPPPVFGSDSIACWQNCRCQCVCVCVCSPVLFARGVHCVWVSVCDVRVCPFLCFQMTAFHPDQCLYSWDSPAPEPWPVAMVISI